MVVFTTHSLAYLPRKDAGTTTLPDVELNTLDQLLGGQVWFLKNSRRRVLLEAGDNYMSQKWYYTLPLET